MSKRIKFLIFACLVGVLFFWGADSVWALASSDLGMTYGNATGLSATDPRIIIANIIRVILGFLGVLALGLIIYAGFLWMTSNGNQEKIDKAKNILKAAIIGLIIILASFGIATFLINNILSATGNQTGSGPGTGGPTIPTSSPGTTYCDAAGTPGVCTTPDHSMCNINEYCDPSSCTCQPQGGPGDECSASTTACIPQDIQCISDECEPDCHCADTPIIEYISPMGGFCENNINTPCQNDSDCSGGDVCDHSTPNGAPGNLVSIGGHYFGTTTGNLYFVGVGGTTTASMASAVNPNCNDNWGPNQIVAVVPSGISATSTIAVERSDGMSDSSDNAIGPAIPDFLQNTIERPGLCQLSTSSAHMHDTITYQGIRLQDSEAYFGSYGDSVPAYDSHFSTSTLNGDAEVPSIEAGDTTTYVEEADIYSNYMNFTKLPEPYTGPYISSFSAGPPNPHAGPAGEYVTIRGDGFGRQQGSKRVYFGTPGSGYEASYDFPAVCQESVWTDDQVIVKVPSSASDGNYIITMEIGSWTIDTSELSPNQFDIDNTLPVTPNLCKIQPTMGPQNSDVSLWGEDFGNATDTVRFYRNQDQTDIDHWGPSASGDAQRVDTTVHQNALTGPTRVLRGGLEGNGMEFRVGLCTEADNPDQACGASQICCPQGTMEEGRCRNSMSDCYLNILSSVYEWEFDTGFGTTSIDNSNFSSCEERSQALDVCSSTLMCPNSSGRCSFYEGGDTSVVVEDGCTAAYCNSGVGNCGTGGNDCDYNNTMNQCVYLTGGGSEVECDLPQERTLTFNGNPRDYDTRCVEYNGAGHWQLRTDQSCPGGWINVGNNRCLDSISPTTPTCDICENGSCSDDQDGDDRGFCAANGVICPNGASCSGDDCVRTESSLCECCCRIGNNAATGEPYAQQDCCSFLDPSSNDVINLSCEGDCGSDATATDTDTYGYCSGCRIDEDGNGTISPAEQQLSDEACVCSGSEGKYCDVEADPDGDGTPEGVCRDCATLNTAELCSNHHSTCCVDAEESDACRGGTGDFSMITGDSPDLAYCQYYQCDLANDICDIPNPVPSSTQETYTSTSTCQTECALGTPSGLGMSCHSLTSTTSCNTSICSNPFQCLTSSGGGASYPDCGYCCCDPDSTTDCDSYGTGLNCQADKSPCTGADRGLCCGCSEDGDCGDPADVGCGSDTCCRNRPGVSSTTPADGAEQICSNALITANFDSQMRTSSLIGNVIVVGEYSQPCPDGTTYLASRENNWQNSDNILARLWGDFKQKIYRTWHKIASLFTDQAYASDPPSPANNYCAVSGSVEGNHLSDGTTQMTFTPNQLLDTDRKYFVIIRGDEDLDSETGVLSSWGIGINASSTSPVISNSNFNGIQYPHSYIWSFTTLPDQGNNGVCAVDHVDIKPSSYLFKTTDNSLDENDSNPNDNTFDTVSIRGYDRDKVFRAIAKSGGDDPQSLAPISTVYSWNWNWSIDNTQIVDFNTAPFSADSNRQLVAAQNDVTDGNTNVRAEINLIDDIGGYGGDGTEGMSEVWVFICNNPWPPFASDGTWQPWRDNVQGSDPNCVEGSCPAMNYEIYYCRDSGQRDITADDLPAILSEDTINREGQGDIVKESYFFRELLPTSEGISLSATGTSTNWNEGGVVGLDWNDISVPPEETLEEYRVYYGTHPGTPYSNSLAVEPTAAPYNTGDLYEIDGLSNGQTYYFSVTAVYESGAESDYSSEVSAVPADVVAPTAPNINDFVVKNGSVDLVWQDTSSGEASEFIIYYKADSTCSAGLNFGDSISVNYQTSGTTTVSDLANGVDYCLGMVAEDNNGNASSIETLADTIQPFAFPVNFNAQHIGTSSVKLDWDYSDGSGDGVDHVRIYRGSSSQSYSWNNNLSGTPASSTVSGLTPGTSYYFNIRTFNTAGEQSDYGGEISVTTGTLP